MTLDLALSYATDTDGQTKQCNACREVKPLCDFNKRNDRPCGVRPECRECQRARTIRWRESEQGKAHEASYKLDEEAQARIKENRKIPERLANDAARHKRWRDTPEGNKKLRAIIKKSQSKPSSKAKRAANRSGRYRNDPDYACEVIIRSMLGRVLRASSMKKETLTADLLGYTALKLRHRVECQFKPGMWWDNRSEWHIDHRKPVSVFLSQGVTDPKTINALCNLRPMWAEENMRKGASWPVAANDNNPRETPIAGAA